MSKAAPTTMALATPEQVTQTERARLAIELAAKQVEAEADATPAALATIVVANADDYSIVTELRANARKERDKLVELRQTAAQPWKKVATTIEEMFRPIIRAYETIEADFKTKLDAYTLAQVKRERELRLAATQAAIADDSEALTTALNASAAIVVKPEGAGRARVRWVRKRVNQDLLPDEWWTPDLAKIDAVAGAHKGDDPPIIPGVVFEQDVSTAVKKGAP